MGANPTIIGNWFKLLAEVKQKCQITSPSQITLLLAFAEGAVPGGSFTVSVDVHRPQQAEEEEDVGDVQDYVEEEG